MLFYPARWPDVTTSSAEDAAALSLPGQAGMVAVRAADLASPAGPGLGKDGRSALVAAGGGRIRSGDVVVFLKPVAVAPAVVRRDGRVQAGGHPADHARLGVAEDRLDALAGQQDVIGQIAAGVRLGGKVRGAARRAMTPALTIRLTLLMTLMPGDADYAEVLAALLGDLALVPWQRPYQVPTATVASTWRDAVGPGPLQELRDLVLAGVDAEHREHDFRAVMVGDLDVCSIDGSLTRVPDTPANRQAFGSAGTADDSSPYPQLRELRCSHASTRAALAVTCGPSGAAAGGGRDKGEAEQVLLDKALTDYPQVFTPGRIWIMDRNFPGAPRIERMLATGTHVLIRVKDGITLERAGGFLPDGSYLASITGGGVTLTVRVIEYTVSVAGADAPELFALITDLLDDAAYPAQRARRRLSLALDRVGNLPEGSQVRDPRRRALHRADAPLTVPGPGRPGARRLDHRHRAGPRHGPRRRGHRGPGRQGQARRPARPRPRDLVHRRPPRRHHHHPVRRSHRQPARHADPGPPRRHPGRPGPPPRRHRPQPPPRPENQGPAGLPARRAAPAHPDRRRPDQRLRTPRRLNRGHIPVRSLRSHRTTRRPWNQPQPGATSGPPPCLHSP